MLEKFNNGKFDKTETLSSGGDSRLVINRQSLAVAKRVRLEVSPEVSRYH